MCNKCSKEHNKKMKYIKALLFPEQFNEHIPTKNTQLTNLIKINFFVNITSGTTGAFFLNWFGMQAPCVNANTISAVISGTYTGIASAAFTNNYVSCPTDTSGIMNNSTLCRLVGASLTVVPAVGSGAMTSLMCGATYNSTQNITSGDANLSITNALMELPNFRMKKTDGMKIVFVPNDICMEKFVLWNTVMGQGSSGLISTNQRMAVFIYGPTSATMNFFFTQVFEINPTTTNTPHWFCPYSNHLPWYPDEYIKKYIIEKNIIVTFADEWKEILTSIENEMKPVDSSCPCKQKIKLTKNFFMPGLNQKFRLPSLFGEKTCLLKQRVTFDMQTSTNGAFFLQWIPQIYNQANSGLLTGLYHSSTSPVSNFDGLNNHGTVIISTILDEPFGSFANGSTTIPFNSVRLVSAAVKFVFQGETKSRSGQITSGIILETPQKGTNATVISTTNLNYQNIGNFPISKTIDAFDGTKMIYVPFDYSCFEFIPINYLSAVNTIQPPMLQTFYAVGYGFSPLNADIKLIFERVFEAKLYAGFSTTTYNSTGLFEQQLSHWSMEKCQSMTNKIILNDLVISKVVDESKNLNTLLNN